MENNESDPWVEAEPDDSMNEFDALFTAAKKVCDAAYAPYSRFKVGAAVRGPSGVIHVGCNVENAAFPVGSCAEVGAIAAMIAAGERRICDILIVGDSDEAATPCGACRQRIAEFADALTRIVVADASAVQRVYHCSDLLPDAFGPNALRRKYYEASDDERDE